MRNIHEIDFMFEIAFNKTLPDFYDEAFQTLDDKILLTSDSEELPQLSNKIKMVYDVPSFLKVSKKNFKPSLGLKSVIQHKGYCINLRGYNDIETYLKDRFSRNSRQVFRSNKKRLETCFDISYNMYYGAISIEQYSKLFKQFYDMLT